MKKTTEAIDRNLKTIILRRYGDEERDLLEVHLSNIDKEGDKSERNKKKYFGIAVI